MKKNVGIEYVFEPVDEGTETERAEANDYEVFDNTYNAPDVATAQGLVGSVGAGGIILSHDARSQPTGALVRAVVAAAAAVRDQGLALVTVSELLRLDAAASS